MGCASSIQSSDLTLRSPTNRSSDSFAGTFLVVCGKEMKLDRDIRATLKLRATMVNLDKKDPYTNGPFKDAHIIWEVGGVVSKRGTVLQPGENKIDFDFPLEGKLKETDKFIQPQELVSKFGKCTFIAYDYIIRVGSLQIKETVQYPPLLPPKDDGIRVIEERKGLSLSTVQGLAKAALGVTSLAVSF